MDINKLITPIYTNQEGKDELVGTGFLIKESGKNILVTSGHTFYENYMNEYGKEAHKPNYNSQTDYFYVLINGEKLTINFDDKYSEVVFNTIGFYNDYAFFYLEETKIEKGLSIENFELLEDKENFNAYGFNPSTGKLEEFNRIVKASYLDEKLEGRFTNLLCSKGESLKGNSGGPILNKDNRVIGMITRGQLRHEGEQQWFIKSDYLIKKLTQFMAKLEQDKAKQK